VQNVIHPFMAGFCARRNDDRPVTVEHGYTIAFSVKGDSYVVVRALVEKASLDTVCWTREALIAVLQGRSRVALCAVHVPRAADLLEFGGPNILADQLSSWIAVQTACRQWKCPSSIDVEANGQAATSCYLTLDQQQRTVCLREHALATCRTEPAAV
jgi:hypothetical protein